MGCQTGHDLLGRELQTGGYKWVFTSKAARLSGQSMGISVKWSRVQIPPSYSWLDLLFGWLVKYQVQLLGHTSVNSLFVSPRPVEILNYVSLSLKNPLRVADKYKYFLNLFSFDPGKVPLMRLWRVGQTLPFLPTTANVENFFLNSQAIAS